MRVSSKTPLSKYRLILAEDVEAFLPRGEYQELLEFESDIAQISELLLLFSESAGSLAELGAFVMDDDVAPRMMVVIDNDNYSSDSFIKLGPLYTLRLHHGEASVCVLMLNDINLKCITDVSGIDLEKLRDAMKAPLAARIAKRREPKTFDKTRNGHVTKLITGLVQYYSALTLDEIDALLYCLEIPTSLDDIKKHRLCAKIFDWIVIEKRGIETYYADVGLRSAAIDFDFIPGIEKIDRIRWRADILDYWKAADPERFKAIVAARSAR